MGWTVTFVRLQFFSIVRSHRGDATSQSSLRFRGPSRFLRGFRPVRPFWGWTLRLRQSLGFRSVRFWWLRGWAVWLRWFGAVWLGFEWLWFGWIGRFGSGTVRGSSVGRSSVWGWCRGRAVWGRVVRGRWFGR
ncbi:hypothetical protein GCM10009630_57380 [Kribbella jejuensis]|uniref:Uncharacterized protein n=1 Tax=Kribbella jejuensis TaxID=236068 RepID=A0A542ENI9_9ACTN|nr:hypothetical protein FB475_1024 [Kribbella jejuensis]